MRSKWSMVRLWRDALHYDRRFANPDWLEYNYAPHQLHIDAAKALAAQVKAN